MARSCSCSATGKRPTDVLRDEHRVIERVLDATEKQVHSGRIDRRFFVEALDFFRNFADGCHHAKEEDELFPVLESAGIPREGGPIGCMLHEHEEGRAFLRRVSDHLDRAVMGDAAAAKEVRDAATGYIRLLRQHIQKEDDVLFVMAEHALGSEEQRLLKQAFDRAETAGGDVGKHERYVALADDLCRRTASSV
jgi:hemerythrin-like domain-containing protein